MVARQLDRYWVAIPGFAAAAAVGLLSAISPLAALVALAAIVLLVVVATQPLAVLVLLLAAMPWEGMLGYPTETLTVVKALGGLLFVSYLITAMYAGRSLRFPPTAVAIAALLLLVGMALIASPDPGAGLETALRFFLFAAFFFLVVQLVDDEADLRKVLGVLTLSMAAAGLWALGGFLWGGADRVGGPIEEPNDFAFLIVVVLPAAIYLLLEDARRQWLWAACLPILAAALLGTLSRGAFVAILVVAAWLILSGRVRVGGIVVAAGSTLALLGTVFLLWGSTIGDRIEQKGSVAATNVEGRLALWDAAGRMAMDRPVLGVGPGRFRAESVEYVRGFPLAIEHPVAHNTYLEVLAENGLPALLAFLAFLAGSWALLARRAQAARLTRDRRMLRLTTALQASLLGAATAALFLQGQYHPPLWLAGAFAVIASGAGWRMLDADR